MFRREVVEGHQYITVFFQARTRLLVLRPILFQEDSERLVGILSCLGKPVLVKVRFGSWLHTLGHFVEYAGSLVNPALLLADFWIHLAACEALGRQTAEQLLSQGAAALIETARRF
jgi:hypothetical protein